VGRIVTRREAARELAARAAYESLSACTELCWPYQRPGKRLVRGWAFDALVEHVEAWIIGLIPILGIAVPPGSSKSTIASRVAPFWAWLKHPEWRFICASYDVPTAVDFNRDRRDLVDNPQLRALLRPPYRLRKGQRGAGKFSNDKTGYMMATSPDSQATGYHSTRFILDDSLKPKDVYGPRLEKHDRWFSETIQSRFEEQATPHMMAVSQRLHQRDSVGLLKELYPDAELLIIPAEADTKRPCVTVLGFRDPREVDGESFNPIRYPKTMFPAKRRQLGRQMYSAQFLQKPLVEGGAILFKEWFDQNRYRVIPSHAKSRGHWLFSLDCTFHDGAGTDYVVAQVWLEHAGQAWLVHQTRRRMTFTQTMTVLEALRETYPLQRKCLIEGKASGNGDAIADALTRGRPGESAKRVRGVEVIKPQDSKGTRAAAVAPLLEAGVILFPEDELAPWMVDFVKEVEAFTGAPGMEDDQVDAMTQALNHLRARLVRGAARADREPRRQPLGGRRDHLDGDAGW